MSRVTYANIATTAEQGQLREAHRVRLVTAAEEGTGIDRLPTGVYGFTYAPATPNAPLFSDRRFRCFEMHKLSDGDVLIIGFVTRDAALQLSTASDTAKLRLMPDPDASNDTLVVVSHSRLKVHQQFSAPNEQGLEITVAPALESA
ncbi:MAG: hypothetical protein AB7G23_08295 [Vicinamibacterales bacterium]